MVEPTRTMVRCFDRLNALIWFLEDFYSVINDVQFQSFVNMPGEYPRFEISVGEKLSKVSCHGEGVICNRWDESSYVYPVVDPDRRIAARLWLISEVELLRSFARNRVDSGANAGMSNPPPSLDDFQRIIQLCAEKFGKDLGVYFQVDPIINDTFRLHGYVDGNRLGVISVKYEAKQGQLIAYEGSKAENIASSSKAIRTALENSGSLIGTISEMHRWWVEIVWDFGNICRLKATQP